MKIHIGIVTGTATLEDLNIANPPNYQKPYFFDLSNGTATVSLKTIMEETIEIDSIELTGITMYLEPGKGGTYNYEQILENIEKYSERQETEPAPESKTKVIVRHLALRDLKVYYKLKGLNFIEAPVEIPEIVMKNIGEEGSEVDMEKLMSIIITGALRGIASRMPQIIGAGIKAGIGELGEIGKVAGQAALDAAKSAGKELDKGIKKILGGD